MDFEFSEREKAFAEEVEKFLAELGADVKNELSHRARAMAAARSWLLAR